jgi:hypothetical protein
MVASTPVAERKVLSDAIGIGWTDLDGGAQAATAFGILGLQQVAFAGMHAHDLAAGRDLEPLGHGLPGFNTFWATHNRFGLFRKKSAKHSGGTGGKQAGILPIKNLLRFPNVTLQ